MSAHHSFLLSVSSVLSSPKLAHTAREGIRWGVGILWCLLLYILPFLINMPDSVGLMFIREFSPVIIAMLLLLWMAYRLPGQIGFLMSFGGTLLLFALPLAAIWDGGFSSMFAIGGLLPWSDASSYYGDALRLLEGDMFQGASLNRPLFPASLAVILALTGKNLQLTLMILLLLVAVAVFFLAREVRQTHGAAGAVLILTLLWLFFRSWPYVSTVLTENLGVIYGALGTALLWRGAGQRHPGLIAGGILLLTLALNARAGAFFVLPALVVWSALLLRGRARLSLRAFALSSAAVILGFALSLGMFQVVKSGDSMPFSNYSYTLYGLAAGGKGWKYLRVDHPEIMELPRNERRQRIYELAFDQIRARPHMLLVGMAKAVRDYLGIVSPGFVSYVYVNSGIYAALFQMLVYIGSFVGFGACLIHYRNPHTSLVLAATSGTLLSVPLVPPIDAGIRAYAATIPFSALLAVVGIIGAARFYAARRARRKASTTTRAAQSCPGEQESPAPPSAFPPHSVKPLVLFSSVLVSLFLVVPVLIRLTSTEPQITAAPCADDELETLYFRMNPGTSILLVQDDKGVDAPMPVVNVPRSKLLFINYIDEFPKELDTLSYPVVLTKGAAFQDTGIIFPFLFVEPSMLPDTTGIFRVCAEPSDYADMRKYHFYRARSIEAMPGTGDG
jgi:hypothetical protein